MKASLFACAGLAAIALAGNDYQEIHTDWPWDEDFLRGTSMGAFIDDDEEDIA